MSVGLIRLKKNVEYISDLSNTKLKVYKFIGPLKKKTYLNTKLLTLTSFFFDKVFNIFI